jgi:Arc/MetJ-type ribon-helix-helix transcriptional regulator
LNYRIFNLPSRQNESLKSGLAIMQFAKSSQHQIHAQHDEMLTMIKSKIAITISPLVLNRLDAWEQNDHFASRSEAIEQAVEVQLHGRERTRLSEQCALLDIDEEQAMADMALVEDSAALPAF